MAEEGEEKSDDEREIFMELRSGKAKQSAKLDSFEDCVPAFMKYENGVDPHSDRERGPLKRRLRSQDRQLRKRKKGKQSSSSVKKKKPAPMDTAEDWESVDLETRRRGRKNKKPPQVETIDLDDSDEEIEVLEARKPDVTKENTKTDSNLDDSDVEFVCEYTPERPKRRPGRPKKVQVKSEPPEERCGKKSIKPNSDCDKRQLRPRETKEIHSDEDEDAQIGCPIQFRTRRWARERRLADEWDRSNTNVSPNNQGSEPKESPRPGSKLKRLRLPSQTDSDQEGVESNTDTSDAASIDNRRITAPIDEPNENEHSLDYDSAMKLWEHEKTKYNEYFAKKKKSNPNVVGECSKSAENTTKEKRRASEAEENQAIAQDVEAIVSQSSAEPPTKKQIFRIAVDGGGQCKYCQHVCGRSTPLPWHLDHFHRFRCETCVKVFDDAKELGRHRRKIHRTKHYCDLCEREYLTEAGYKNHKRSRMHIRLIMAQTKLYNAILRQMEVDDDVMIDVQDRDPKVIQEYFKANTKSEFKPANGTVVVHDSEVLEFLSEKGGRIKVSMAAKMEAPSRCSSIPYQSSMESGYASMPSPPPMRFDIPTGLPVLKEESQSSGSSCSHHRMQPRPLISKQAVLSRGRELILDQVAQAFEPENEEVMAQVFQCGVVQAVSTSDLTEADLLDLDTVCTNAEVMIPQESGLIDDDARQYSDYIAQDEGTEFAQVIRDGLLA